MKKLLALTVILLFLLASCSGGLDLNPNYRERNSDIIGTWFANYGADNKGAVKLEIDCSNIAPFSPFGLWVYSWNIIMADPDGAVYTGEGSWVRGRSTIDLTTDGGENTVAYIHKATLLNGKLMLNLDSSFSYPSRNTPKNHELTKDVPAVPIEVTTLRVRNESSVTVGNIRWNNTTYPVNTWTVPGTNATAVVEAGTGYIYFDAGDANSSVPLRTNTPVTVERNEQQEFTLINNTVVAEVNNPGVIKTLGEYAR